MSWLYWLCLYLILLIGRRWREGFVNKGSWVQQDIALYVSLLLISNTTVFFKVFKNKGINLTEFFYLRSQCIPIPYPWRPRFFGLRLHSRLNWKLRKDWKRECFSIFYQWVIILKPNSFKVTQKRHKSSSGNIPDKLYQNHAHVVALSF